jgi:hypothetical protein
MRTTVDIADPVLKELREVQEREGSTLGALVSRLLSLGLAEYRRQPSPPATLAWTARPMRALVDLADKEAVYALLDDGRAPAKRS